MNAILYRYRAGVFWRDWLEQWGGCVVHTYHTRWNRTGVWKHVFEILATDADNEYAIIDATIARAHQHRDGAKKTLEKNDQAIGRSKGGLSTTIHAICNAWANPQDSF